MADAARVPARRGDQTDDYHGELVHDPYRWLEDTDSPETREWIVAQNAVTQQWLGEASSREPIRKRLTELWDYPRRSTPWRRGERWFAWRNTGLQNQAVLHVAGRLEDEGRVLLDPNELSPDGTVAVSDSVVSEDGELLLYATSAAGSDWLTWRVLEVASGQARADVVEWSKYASGAWLPDGSGFLYGAIEAPQAGEEYLEAAGVHRIQLHRLGCEQAEDELVFEAPEHPDWITNAEVSDDGRYLILTTTRGTAPQTGIRVRDLKDPSAELHPLVDEFSAKTSYVTNLGSQFLLLTDDGAERGRIVSVDLTAARRTEWTEVVPESAGLLRAAGNCGGQLVLHVLRDACSELQIVGLSGGDAREVSLPPVSSLLGGGEVGFAGHPNQSTIQFTVTSFMESGALWQHDLLSGETRQLQASAAGVDAEAYVSRRVMVRADDGVELPVFLTHRRDIEPTGEVPVLLYGYGGFDVTLTPGFQVGFAAFVERGGVFAMAVLRGGGEYGRAWHEAGIHAVKQRVFDDFRDCARWLTGESGWTDAAHLAINGGSNGGLLVGASVNQHPELFGAAVAEVGVLDMLRFHRFTIGWAWKSDYGDPDDPAQYPWVRAYSPLHNVQSRRPYPPILLTTGDHDDRVIPGHTFKYAATLQAAAAKTDTPTEPVLVRIETSAGHGHGMPTEKAIALTTDILAFLDATVGTALLPSSTRRGVEQSGSSSGS